MKSILFRLSARLCIVTLLFQSLWPTVVLATEGEVLPQISQQVQGLAPESLSSVRLEAFVTDQEDQGLAQRRAVDIPLLPTQSDIQDYIDQSREIQSLYPGLQLVEQGLQWSAYGYQFLIDARGSLLMSAERSATKTLTVFNPQGDVWLGEGINLDYLSIRGRNVIHTGAQSSVRHLDVSATGTFCNHDTASLIVQEMTVFEGIVHNQGILSVTNDGKLDLFNHDMVNEGAVRLEKGSSLEGVRVLKNTGTIEGTRYKLRAQIVENRKTIAGADYKIITTLKLANFDEITGQQNSEIVCYGDFENAGIVDLADAGKVFIGKTMTNSGHICSQNLNLTILGKVMNDPLGLVLSQESLVFEGPGEILNRGRIEGQKALAFKNKKVVNEHLILALDHFTLATQELFHNTSTGSVLVKGRTTISGSGKIQNDKLVFAPDAPDTELSPAGMGFAQDVTFDHYQGFLLNEGSFNTGAHFLGVLNSLTNTGVFGANQGFADFTITSLINAGHLFGDGHLIVTEARQEGSLSSETLALTILTSLVNRGFIHVTKSLKTDGAGEFENWGDIQTPLLQMDHRTFTHHSRMDKTPLPQVELGAHMHRFTIAENAVLTITDLKSTMDAVEGVFYNQGELTVADTFTNHAPCLRNAGTLKVKTWDQQGKKVLNELGGDLTVEQKTTLNVDSLVNRGTAQFGGTVIGQITDLVNAQDLTFADSTMLTGTTLGNSGSLRAKNVMGWKGEAVENSGNLSVLGYYILPQHQFINRGYLRWTHDTLRCVSHFLNLGVVEQTAALEADFPALPHVADQSVTYKPLTFENRGVFSVTPTHRPKYIIGQTHRPFSAELFKHWLNAGTLRTKGISLKGAETLLNQGIWEYTSGTAAIDGLVNQGTFSIQTGSYVTVGHIMPGAGKPGSLIVQNGAKVTLSDLDSVRMTLLENQGELTLLKGTAVDIESVVNGGKLAVTGALTGRITKLANTKDAHATIADLDSVKMVILENQGDLTLLKGTAVDIESVVNGGKFTVKGSLTGKITTLVNTADLLFLEDADLTGTTLTNHNLLKAEKRLEWSGETIENTGSILIHRCGLQPTQLINRHILRWMQDQPRASHFLNMGLLEKTDQWNAEEPPKIEPAKDQSTTYKPLTVENRGIWLMIPTYKLDDAQDKEGTSASHTSLKHWINTGDLRMKSAALDGAETVINRGIWELTGYTSGTVGRLENFGIFAVREGKLTLKTVIHQGKDLILEKGSYTVDSWKDAGAKKTLIDKLTFTGGFLNFESLEAVIADLTMPSSYRHLWIDHKLKISSQSLVLPTLTVGGTLELGQGQYRIAEFKSGYRRADGPALILHPDAYVMTNKLPEKFGPIAGVKSLHVLATLGEESLKAEDWVGMAVLHLQKVSEDLKWIDMLGELQAKERLIVHLPAFNVAHILSYYEDKWYGEEALELHGTTFVNDGSFLKDTVKDLISKRNVRLFLTGAFKSEQQLTLPSLFVRCDSFVVSKLAQIKANGKIDVESKGDIDVKAGKVQSQDGYVLLASLNGNIHVGAPIGAASNGACVTSYANEIGLGAFNGSIFTDYGLVQNCSERFGISFYAPKGRLHNQTGQISSMKDIAIEVNALEVVTGGYRTDTVHTMVDYNPGCSITINGQRITLPPQESTRTTPYLISAGGVIQTADGSIKLICNSGLISGSQVLAAKDILYKRPGDSDFTSKNRSGNPSWLRIEDFQGPYSEGNFSCGPFGVGSSGMRTLSPQRFMAGGVISIEAGKTTVSGTMSAQNIRLQVDGLSLSGKIGTVSLPNGGQLAMLKIALDQPGVKNELSSGGGVKPLASTSDKPQKDPITGDPKTMVQSGPGPVQGTPQANPAEYEGVPRSPTDLCLVPVAIDPMLLRSAINYSLSTFLGRLNLYQLSGDALLARLVTNTKICLQTLHTQGRSLTVKNITSFDEALLYMCQEKVEGHEYLVHYLYLPPRFALPGATMSAIEDITAESTGPVRMDGASTSSGGDTKVSAPGQPVTLTGTHMQTGGDLSLGGRDVALDHTTTDSGGKTEEKAERKLDVKDSDQHAKGDLSAEGGEVDVARSSMASEEKARLHARQKLTAEESTISGVASAAVTSDGDMTLKRGLDRKTVTEGNTTTVIETARPPVVVQSQGTTTVTSAGPFLAVAPIIQGVGGHVGSTGSSTSILALIEKVEKTSQETVTRGGGFLRRKKRETHTRTEHVESPVVPVINFSGGSGVISSGPQSPLVTEGLQASSSQNLTFTGGHLDARAAIAKNWIRTTSSRSGGSFLGMFGGTSRFSESYAEMLGVQMGLFSAGQRLSIATHTAETHGVNMEGTVFEDLTKSSFFGPAEADVSSFALETRDTRGIFSTRSARSSVSGSRHLVFPAFLRAQTLILGDGTGGRTELQSMHVEADHLVVNNQDLIQSAAQESSSEERHMRSSDGPVLELPKPPSLSLTAANGLDRTSEVLERATMAINMASQALQMAQGELSPVDFALQQFGTLTWSRSRMDSFEQGWRDVPTYMRVGDLEFIGRRHFHVMGHNEVGTVHGTLGSITSEPLRQVRIFDLQAHQQQGSFNPFTLTAGYSEQDHREHAYDLVNQASTLVINGQGDLDVSGEAAFVGTQVSGPGQLHVRAAEGIRLESVADVHEASSHTSGVSVAVNLPMAAAGDPLGFLGTGGQNSRTYDYDSYVDQGAAGIQMGGGQTLDGPVTVIEPPTVSIHREESCIPLSFWRLASAGYQNTQAVQGLMQTLSPPAERFQSELYMALDEEGVSPTESMEIMADPEVREVVEEVQQYVDRQILRQQKGKGRAAEPVASTSAPSSSAAAAASAVQSLDMQDPSHALDIIAQRAQQGTATQTPEGSALQRRVTAVLGKFKHSGLVEQAQYLGDLMNKYVWVGEMAVDLINLYNLRGHLFTGMRILRALHRGENPYPPRPGDRRVIDETAQEMGNPTELGSYSEAPEFGGSTLRRFMADETGGMNLPGGPRERGPSAPATEGSSGAPPRVTNPSKTESPVWKSFLPYRGPMKTNGLQGRKKEYYTWDYTHSDIEVLNHNMEHKGSMDPITGEMYKPSKGYTEKK